MMAPMCFKLLALSAGFSKTVFNQAQNITHLMLQCTPARMLASCCCFVLCARCGLAEHGLPLAQSMKGSGFDVSGFTGCRIHQVIRVFRS